MDRVRDSRPQIPQPQGTAPELPALGITFQPQPPRILRLFPPATLRREWSRVHRIAYV
jgi:hypothetical protein